MNYDIRFGILPSNEIWNICGPESAGPSRREGYDVEKGRQKSAHKYIDRLNTKSGFYDKLEKSILQEGFRNPILVTCGFLPKTRWKHLPPEIDPEKCVACDRLGGSRLWIAQKYIMEIPCIISDFNGWFTHLEKLEGKQDIIDKFRDKPDRVIINDHGVNIGNVPQIHLEQK